MTWVVWCIVCILDGERCSFLKQQLHGGLPEAVDAETLRRENDELQKRNRELEAKVAELTATVS